LSFSDNDKVLDDSGKETIVTVSKDEENLEKLEKKRERQILISEMMTLTMTTMKAERLVIGDNVKLDVFDVNDLNKPSTVELAPPVLDFEVLS
jgi:hypothetical protein